MTNPELESSKPQPSDTTGLRPSWWRRIRRTSEPVDAKIDEPSTPENPYYEKHRNRLAAQMQGYFDAVDARVGEMIGYSGSIREEIKGRASDGPPHARPLNVEGLDTSLRRYVQHSIFSFRLDNEEGGPAVMYTVNCQVGMFTPSVYMETHDGSVEATLHLGPDRDKFEHVKVRRVFNDGRVRQVSTFAPNYMNAYDLPHPLVVEWGEHWMPDTHVIYDTVDEAGNVTLLDGQTMRFGGTVGRYSSLDHTVSPTTGRAFPYDQTDTHLILGGRWDSQTHIPLQTNIYDELSGIMSIKRAIDSR